MCGDGGSRSFIGELCHTDPEEIGKPAGPNILKAHRTGAAGLVVQDVSTVLNTCYS